MKPNGVTTGANCMISIATEESTSCFSRSRLPTGPICTASARGESHRCGMRNGQGVSCLKKLTGGGGCTLGNYKSPAARPLTRSKSYSPSARSSFLLPQSFEWRPSPHSPFISADPSSPAPQFFFKKDHTCTSIKKTHTIIDR